MSLDDLPDAKSLPLGHVETIETGGTNGDQDIYYEVVKNDSGKQVWKYVGHDRKTDNR